MTSIECEYCGVYFAAERTSARYCCNSHKTMANLQRRENEKVVLRRKIEQDKWLEWSRQQTEASRKRQEQFEAEQDERKRLHAEENRKSDEKMAADAAIKHKAAAEKRKKDHEKALIKMDEDLKIKGFYILLLLGAANLILNSVLNPTKDAPPTDTMNPSGTSTNDQPATSGEEAIPDDPHLSIKGEDTDTELDSPVNQDEKPDE